MLLKPCHPCLAAKAPSSTALLLPPRHLPLLTPVSPNTSCSSAPHGKAFGSSVDPCRRTACRAFGGGSSEPAGSASSSNDDNFVEVKVDSVRINKQKGSRPLTHDCTKACIQAVGFKVTKIRITELVSSTYYSRIHLAPIGGGQEEVDLDARPSDAINLAVRFGAPMYISKRIAENATAYPAESFSTQSESHAEIVRSVRDTLASFEDPTTMLQLQKELAIQEERYADAQMFQQAIFDQMTHSVMLRLVVAMEAALADGRYEEAAKVRDDYRRLVATQAADTATKKQ